MLVLLGEVGGIEEYTVCDLLKSGRITKPIVAWCIGTCSDMFSTDVQVWSQTLFTSREAAGHGLVQVKKEKKVTYGFLAIVAFMFGDFHYF